MIPVNEWRAHAFKDLMRVTCRTFTRSQAVHFSPSMQELEVFAAFTKLLSPVKANCEIIR